MKLLSRLVIALVICLIAIPGVTFTTTVQAQEEPEIWLYPSSGHPGDEIRLYGVNFEPDDKVRIYYYVTSTDYEVVKTDTVDDDGEFSVRFIVPESSTGDHRVKAKDESYDEDSDYFTVEPGLEISPEEGAVGTKVSVTGLGFEEDEEDIQVRYYLDGSDYEKVADDITADEYGSWAASFTVPVSSKGEHRIDAKGDDSTLSEVEEATFTVKPGISLSKSSGFVGDTVTVNGSGFGDKESGIKVTYDGKQVGSTTTADNYGVWEMSFEVPPSTRGKHEIDAYGSSTSAATISDKDFSVSPEMTLTPTQGYVGLSLSVSGTGFAETKLLSVKYDATEVASGSTDNKGNFSVSFTTPKSIHGAHTVTVSDALGNTGSSNFVMESKAPPKPTLSLPENGLRIGFISKVAPTFEWAAVNDPSGVSYTFQIASDASFATLVIPELAGSSQTSYALPQGQALPYGTYYWRVKAIDGAQNDSGWTTAYSFKSGFLPLWAFIAIAALIAVLIGVLVYFFVIRRRGVYD